MTTERRPANHGARQRTSPLELRLYLVALLAAVYSISWRAIAPTAPEPPRSSLPAGWQPAPEPTQPARVMHTPRRREPRVRTRSS